MLNHLTPRLVAHRGYSSNYPENTLLSMEQALQAGACYLECDVHLTRDKVPVLVHDHQLQRTTGKQGNVLQLAYKDLAPFTAGYMQRFAGRFADEPLPALAQLTQLMRGWPQRQVFVELKRASIRQFGRDIMLQAVLAVLQPVIAQVILLSFDEGIIEMAQRDTGLQTGWVMEDWTPTFLQVARQLNPQYVFLDWECMAGETAALPDAPWQWVVYEIDDAQAARQWIERGATMIETNDIGGLLAAPFFKGGGCSD